MQKKQRERKEKQKESEMKTFFGTWSKNNKLPAIFPKNLFSLLNLSGRVELGLVYYCFLYLLCLKTVQKLASTTFSCLHNLL